MGCQMPEDFNVEERSRQNALAGGEITAVHLARDDRGEYGGAYTRLYQI
jgi:hypothetical protein